ncbi:acid protease [Pleomassaria siparia CBS 279.74]|uniref:Acid protease n=1 Tax=Pleomassaria siparia CBS 279.74 TaxID=1314801 RepID=A0A6G1JZG1_9PLEO|nr:acid protease [Pleomassaria siparia CBS 279.74]
MMLKDRAENTVTTIPLAQVVKPSGAWDGNDGKWSSFTINVGDDGEKGEGQNFRVLISTSLPLIVLPQASSTCNAECAQARGVEPFDSKQSQGFQSNSSLGWNELGGFSIPVDKKWWPTNNTAGIYGTDNVGLGTSVKNAVVFAEQSVVEYQKMDFYMGTFGLAAGPIDGGGGPIAPFLTNFKRTNSTSTVAYGYTAGAYYRNDSKGYLGNLILGGYDETRLTRQNGKSITMPSQSNPDLIVGVQSIIYHGQDGSFQSFTADESGFSAIIDSTLPYIMLPEKICDQFASAFDLDFDNKTSLYTVSTTARAKNLKAKPYVTIKVGSGVTLETDAVTITLPYDAFDLQIGSPFYSTSTNYFPIKKAPAGVFVLGRTFLQEAYIIVDYERANFTVAQAAFPTPSAASIVTIFPEDYVAPNLPLSSTAPSSGKKDGVAPGAVAGIVVGIVVVFLLLGLGAFFFWKRRRNAKKLEDKQGEVVEIDSGTYAATETKDRRISELDTETGKPMNGYYTGHDDDNKITMPFPPISEMESPPAELYSPPPESVCLSTVAPASNNNNNTTTTTTGDYFTKPRRRGATRESSASNTPGTPGGPGPIHELPGDDGQFQVGGLHFDRVESPTPGSPRQHSRSPSNTSLATNIDEVMAGQRSGATRDAPERRPSHARGASDTTVNSDTTAVSQPSPEELESWAMGGTEPRRPLSE